jgi:hypothetical protein
MFTHHKNLFLGLAFCGLLAAVPNVSAKADVLFNSGIATANFSLSGSTLTVTLTNTNTADVLVPNDILTGVFFSAGTATLTPVSATVPGGSAIAYCAACAGVTNVGGEWAYAAGLAGSLTLSGGGDRGISSVGLGLFGNANFGGANLAGPDAVDGDQFGILSAGDNLATGNAGVTNSGGQIKNAVVFVLTVVGSLTEGQIGNVFFQYGSVLNVVPLPPALVLFGTALVGMTVLGRRRRKDKAVQV